MIQSESRLEDGRAVPGCCRDPGDRSCGLSQNDGWEIDKEWLRKYLLEKSIAFGECLGEEWKVKTRISSEIGVALVETRSGGRST